MVKVLVEERWEVIESSLEREDGDSLREEEEDEVKDREIQQRAEREISCSLRNGPSPPAQFSLGMFIVFLMRLL